MTVILVSGTTTVSTAKPGTTSYTVVSSGTLDIVNGGVVSGPIITTSFTTTVNVSSGGVIAGPMVMSGGTLNVDSGGVVSGLLSAGADFDGADVNVSAGGSTLQAVVGEFANMTVGGVADFNDSHRLRQSFH